MLTAPRQSHGHAVLFTEHREALVAMLLGTFRSHRCRSERIRLTQNR
jgi:hypothetical protein